MQVINSHNLPIPTHTIILIDLTISKNQTLTQVINSHHLPTSTHNYFTVIIY
jgi:hypothetical protein